VTFQPYKIVLDCLNCGTPVPFIVRYGTPEPIAILCLKCRERKASRRENVYQKTNGHCAYCGRVLDIDRFSRDHVIPRHRGGPDIGENMIASCNPCNVRKNTRIVEEFRDYIRDKPIGLLDAISTHLVWAKPMLDASLVAVIRASITELRALLLEIDPVFHLDGLDVELFMDGTLEQD
jgi:hypothetical protein